MLQMLTPGAKTSMRPRLISIDSPIFTVTKYNVVYVSTFVCRRSILIAAKDNSIYTFPYD